MITIDFDTSHIPAGFTKESVILKNKSIRLKCRGYDKDGEDGEIVLEDLMFKDFKIMIKTGDCSAKNTKTFDVKQVILLPKDFVDWTKKKSKAAVPVCQNCNHPVKLDGYPIKKPYHIVEGWCSKECQYEPSCKCDEPKQTSDIYVINKKITMLKTTRKKRRCRHCNTGIDIRKNGYCESCWSLYKHKGLELRR